jgi:hypothetical protein
MPVYGRQERDYRSAAICKRGHVETSSVELRSDNIKPRCDKCGALILTACPSCSKPIQGARTVVFGVYSPPEFCTHCGVPMPWASRQARLYELENILDEQEGLSDADLLTIKEQIQELNRPGLADDEQIRHWNLIKKVSPTLIDVGKEIIVSVTSDLVQKQLGLK